MVRRSIFLRVLSVGSSLGVIRGVDGWVRSFEDYGDCSLDIAYE